MIELPKAGNKTTIVGRNGSGKTQFGAWVLSHADFNRRPHVIIDYKGDELLNDIPFVEEIDHKTVPKKPGLYIIHPLVGQDDEVEDWLWKIWERENIGLMVDEGYMIPSKRAFRAILTQGRSKHIGVITLTQRPVEVDRFVFSEADLFSVFHLNDKNDKKRIEEFTGLDTSQPLLQYQSHWYDVKKNRSFILSAAPDRDTILDRYYDRLAPKRLSI